ncbi:DEAD (Asp-Glu-Ala-Asp) box polypeptide DDX3X [Toxoplasma gondii TgCatPRC2]|uniref:RNA helicase n=14 Tax=Toxoplasma gondii TaxID=5811 RepID=B9PMM2_TOXGV|nr:DEAD (Asp-Glu-Ala-Asp) box polypeptide DDX3X [Toxoplasma gondii ME49]EPR62276.1 DEAD (Asp-Glu-Ala-Asp) box polypeptide DDX3X [Toxoplasma gondii GT1]ESS32660.1 DEAD (Asp-Glu-Ala-Asp) box polypeptide DDX3X [Toxoplasma gondii VEG]KFG42687.1 DEAD (Asp-Glu-Ala-Asp) box polypeptide DDX3X [Toxoplasma gondii p89]KFG45375.1 DEAD (Asp-Glu-Ala-Asp) box polypeptide DDX3X [Toxoplasma gondii GAB2-2007-GAL-DOM2]KFG51738.1 DEAD (Asp-Glu-Ala-Asp) box polypeptide DDX3X [Toxoplasma gondii FOU]KFG60881.1 DEAD|eukprot:XP_002366278.1 DEAD (Asp-Glu-Ala-Asp) box polypeptide DDX3X [Toxoplasma gondii ME49]
MDSQQQLSPAVDSAVGSRVGQAAGLQQPKRYVPPHLRNRPPAQDNFSGAGGYPEYPSSSNALSSQAHGQTYSPTDRTFNSSSSNGLAAGSPGQNQQTGRRYVPPGSGDRFSCLGAGGARYTPPNTTYNTPAGGQGEIPGNAAGNAQGGVYNARAAAMQQGGYGSSRTMRASVTGTGWDVRDGRRYVPEKEKDVFSSDKLQSTGIKFDSYDKVPVELKGRGAERIMAIESFQTPGMQIHPLLLQNVSRVNYTKPTPIQKNSIPTILSGRDLMACAQTGSGKTAAFLYPIIARMLQDGPPPLPQAAAGGGSGYRKPPAYPICLVLSPTRELAMQIYEEARKFQFGTGVRTVAVYGGSDVKRQLIDLDGGCDICVATPGRLVDLLERRKVRLGLVQFFVLDEADRMLDMGFLPQIKLIVESFDLPPSPTPQTAGYPSLGGDSGAGRRVGRQTVMFSATFPREIQMLAKDFLEDYIYLAVGRVGSTNEFIRQRLQYADEDQKLKLLVKLLRETEKGLTIIFVETKRKADMIEDYLVDDDFPAVSIHGDRTQQEREEALRLFKAAKCPILVATDVAARGLDISNVTHVINFDLPTNIDDYVHRIGRTGRAGNLGLATSFVNESNKPILRDLLNLLEEAKQDIPSFLPPLVLSCTSSSSRMGGGWGGGRGGRGGGSFGGRQGGAGYGSMGGVGGRSGAAPMGDSRLPATDWRTTPGGSRPMGGFRAAVMSSDRPGGMDAW